MTMTHDDEVEAKRPSVGTKVLVFGCAIFAVLGSFWAIVWFIRSYVEPPRVMLPAPMTLASGESKPAPAPPPRIAEIPTDTARAASIDAGFSVARAGPATTPLTQDAAPDPAAGSGAIADRWAPLSAVAPAPATPAPVEAPSVTVSAPAALATTGTDSNPAIDEVAEGAVPAIIGRAPLPRRKPVQTASAKRLDPPLPRPRPDGPAPQSVFTAVGTTDDRYPGQ
jgi:hypothetical protein